MTDHLTDEDRQALQQIIRWHAAAAGASEEGGYISAGVQNVQRRVEAIVARHVEAERERIAQAIEALSCLVCGDSNGWRHAADEAARIARGGDR